VRDRLKAFDDLSMTSSKTTNRFRIITLCNYKEHQDSILEKPQAKPQAPEGRISDPRPQSDHNQTTTNKNVKNYRGRGLGKKPPDPRCSEFLNWFREEVNQRTGTPYLVTHGKDEGLIKKALSLFDMEKLKDLCLDFLQDDQGKREGFTVGVFYRALNRLAQKHTENPLEAAKRKIREREIRDGKSD
jgi:hypothetical protein